MKFTDNPLLGGGAAAAASSRGATGLESGGSAGRKAAYGIGPPRAASGAGGAGDGPDPLKEDKFLNGYFGR